MIDRGRPQVVASNSGPQAPPAQLSGPAVGTAKSGLLSWVAVSGSRHSSEPWEFSEPRIIEMCLEIPGTSNFQTALTAFASKTTGQKTQMTEASFADAYRVGDLTAWSAAASGGN